MSVFNIGWVESGPHIHHHATPPLYGIHRPNLYVARPRYAATRDYANDTILILIVSVRNNGAPSVAEVGYLQIVPPNGGSSPQTLGIDLPATTTIGLDDPSGTQPTLWLKGSDALYNKTIVQPVATGSLVRGILEYVVKGATSSQIAVPGTTYRLGYKDNFGTPYFAELVYNIKPAVSCYLPGLTEVPAPPSGPAVISPQSSASPSTPPGQ
jgi:hypothetical protein